MELNGSCPTCPVRTALPAAQPAIVRLSADGSTWIALTGNLPVHLIALFREPGIKDGRVVPTVLDLRTREDGSLAAGQRCWVRPFLEALRGLPPGLTVAWITGYAALVRRLRASTASGLSTVLLKHNAGWLRLVIRMAESLDYCCATRI